MKETSYQPDSKILVRGLLETALLIACLIVPPSVAGDSVGIQLHGFSTVMGLTYGW